MAKLVHMPTANDECAQKYQEVKGGKCRAVFFKLTDDEKEIVVEKTIEKGEDYSSFTKSFPDNDIRWCLLDFSYSKHFNDLTSNIKEQLMEESETN